MCVQPTVVCKRYDTDEGVVSLAIWNLYCPVSSGSDFHRLGRMLSERLEFGMPCLIS